MMRWDDQELQDLEDDDVVVALVVHDAVSSDIADKFIAPQDI